VIEGGVASPNRISIDESRRTAVPQPEQAPIAASTPQHQMITDALEKVITAINQADVSKEEKNETKSLLRKLLGSKAAAKALGLALNRWPQNTWQDKPAVSGVDKAFVHYALTSRQRELSLCSSLNLRLQVR